jgi:FkbM family methyltransferase
VKALFRATAPSGALELLRAKRAFARLHYGSARAWRAALSPRMRAMLESSRLGLLPSHMTRRPALVVDVGANVGAWSEAAVHLLHPRKLIAIEPAPEPFAEMQTRLQHRREVQLVRCAIGATSGEAVLHRMDRSEWNSLLPRREDVAAYYPPIGERASLRVPLTTLDKLLEAEPHIDVMKIDVQGGESALMDGGAQALHKTDAVLLEVNFVSHYEGDSLFWDLHRRMSEEFAFSLFRLANAHHSHEGRILWSDAVYVKARILGEARSSGGT